MTTLDTAPNGALQPAASPEAAVERLERLHTAATGALREALERFLTKGTVPTAAERLRFRYPELRVTYRPMGPIPAIKRAYAKFEEPGTYATTVTHPAFFKDYLL